MKVRDVHGEPLLAETSWHDQRRRRSFQPLALRRQPLLLVFLRHLFPRRPFGQLTSLNGFPCLAFACLAHVEEITGCPLRCLRDPRAARPELLTLRLTRK